jgi:GNAT superfamily N-acetyltransferase
MIAVEIRPLEPGDDRSGFESGDPDLDRFFRKYAGQNQFRHHVGTTYLALAGGMIVGFATVSPASICVDDMPKNLARRFPRYPLPVLRLARLAVEQRMQKQGVGRQLLRAVLFLAREMAARVGCIGVLVDAKPAAVQFYRSYGFEELEIREGRLGDCPPPIPMFLPLGSIPDPAIGTSDCS